MHLLTDPVGGADLGPVYIGGRHPVYGYAEYENQSRCSMFTPPSHGLPMVSS